MIAQTELLTEVGKNAPSTFAVIVVVVLFIRYLSKRDGERQETDKARDASFEAFIKEILREHLEAREQSRHAINANTEAMSENTKSNIRLLDKLDSLRAICPYNKST